MQRLAPIRENDLWPGLKRCVDFRTPLFILNSEFKRLELYQLYPNCANIKSIFKSIATIDKRHRKYQSPAMCGIVLSDLSFSKTTSGHLHCSRRRSEQLMFVSHNNELAKTAV